MTNIVLPVEPGHVNMREVREEAKRREEGGLEIRYALIGTGMGNRQFFTATELKRAGKDKARAYMRRVALTQIDDVIQKLELGGFFS